MITSELHTYSATHEFYADKYTEYLHGGKLAAAYACRLLMVLNAPAQSAFSIEVRDAKRLAYLTGLTLRQATMMLASLEIVGLIERGTIETSEGIKGVIKAVRGDLS